VGDFSLFDIPDQIDPRHAARLAGREISVARRELRRRVGSFLEVAGTEEEFGQRLALVRDSITEVARTTKGITDPETKLARELLKDWHRARERRRVTYTSAVRRGAIPEDWSREDSIPNCPQCGSQAVFYMDEGNMPTPAEGNPPTNAGGGDAAMCGDCGAEIRAIDAFLPGRLDRPPSRRSASPFNVCPKCRGKGTEQCSACKGTGRAKDQKGKANASVRTADGVPVGPTAPPEGATADPVCDLCGGEPAEWELPPEAEAAILGPDATGQGLLIGRQCAQAAGLEDPEAMGATPIGTPTQEATPGAGGGPIPPGTASKEALNTFDLTPGPSTDTHKCPSCAQAFGPSEVPPHGNCPNCAVPLTPPGGGGIPKGKPGVAASVKTARDELLRRAPGLKGKGFPDQGAERFDLGGDEQGGAYTAWFHPESGDFLEGTGADDTQEGSIDYNTALDVAERNHGPKGRRPARASAGGAAPFVRRAAGFGICPNCGSENIATGPGGAGENTAQCNRCGVEFDLDTGARTGEMVHVPGHGTTDGEPDDDDFEEDPETGGIPSSTPLQCPTCGKDTIDNYDYQAPPQYNTASGTCPEHGEVHYVDSSYRCLDCGAETAQVEGPGSEITGWGCSVDPSHRTVIMTHDQGEVMDALFGGTQGDGFGGFINKIDPANREGRRTADNRPGSGGSGTCTKCNKSLSPTSPDTVIEGGKAFHSGCWNERELGSENPANNTDVYDEGDEDEGSSETRDTVIDLEPAKEARTADFADEHLGEEDIDHDPSVARCPNCGDVEEFAPIFPDCSMCEGRGTDPNDPEYVNNAGGRPNECTNCEGQGTVDGDPVGAICYACGYQEDAEGRMVEPGNDGSAKDWEDEAMRSTGKKTAASPKYQVECGHCTATYEGDTPEEALAAFADHQDPGTRDSDVFGNEDTEDTDHWLKNFGYYDDDNKWVDLDENTLQPEHEEEPSARPPDRQPIDAAPIEGPTRARDDGLVEDEGGYAFKPMTWYAECGHCGNTYEGESPEEAREYLSEHFEDPGDPFGDDPEGEQEHWEKSVWAWDENGKAIRAPKIREAD
jgi:hypothetical protein